MSPSLNTVVMLRLLLTFAFPYSFLRSAKVVLSPFSLFSPVRRSPLTLPRARSPAHRLLFKGALVARRELDSSVRSASSPTLVLALTIVVAS